MSQDNTKLLHEQTIIISELLIKVTALENAMLATGLVSSDVIAAESKKIVKKLTDIMKQNTEEPVTPNNSGN